MTACSALKEFCTVVSVGILKASFASRRIDALFLFCYIVPRSIKMEVGMKTVSKTIRAKIGYFEELSYKDQNLLMIAQAFRKNAQAPYSHFWVGVAIKSAKSGRIYAGCNVERASYTQTTHAEQNAVDSMVAEEGSQKIMKLALWAAPENDKNANFVALKTDKINCSIDQVPVPCGHCLQIIWENCFNDSSVELISRMSDGRISVTSVGDALPMKFGPQELGVDYSKERH